MNADETVRPLPLTPRLVAMLRELEWGTEAYCAVCGETSPEYTGRGHGADCELDALLKETAE